MKIIHAVWEKRNMGVDCYEVEIEQGDTIEDFLEKKSTFESEYTVVRVSASDSKMGLEVQNLGYKYVETLVTVVKDNVPCNVNPINKRILDEMECAQMDKTEIGTLIDEIHTGMFKTDRISNDPYFTEKQTNDRYVGWLNDELNAGAYIYKILYKNNNIGFFTLREKSNGEYTSALGGIYSSVNVMGCGIALPYFATLKLNELGGKRYITGISMNNRGMMSTYMQIGCSVKYITTVYVGHFDKRESLID